MPEITLLNVLKILSGGFFGGVIGSILTHCFTDHRDRNKRHADFLAVIGEWRAKFRRQLPDAIYDLYSRSVPIIGAESSRIRCDVPDRKESMELADRYCLFTRDQIENPDYARKVKLAGPPMDYEKGRALILDTLEKLEKAS